ncbi:MAG: thymidylate synthase (FAD), partial [Proteobacteria bacterium]|nr:thymidylate synthase (FAD) [Pseudomonadota bacterium]
MGDDLSVTNAARASYMKETTAFRAADERLIAFLASNGHHSPFRHATVSLEIKAPIMIARQWFKYRVSAAHTPDSAEFLGIEMPGYRRCSRAPPTGHGFHSMPTRLRPSTSRAP